MNILTFILFFLLILIIGIIEGIATGKQIKQWYNKLNLSKVSPPNWIFAPAWTILYIMIGISAFYGLNVIYNTLIVNV
jgi:benzodiazapine receptor